LGSITCSETLPAASLAVYRKGIGWVFLGSSVYIKSTAAPVVVLITGYVLQIWYIQVTPNIISRKLRQDKVCSGCCVFQLAAKSTLVPLVAGIAPPLRL